MSDQPPELERRSDRLAEHQRMLAALTDVTFRVALDPDGTVRSVYDVPASSALSASTLRDRLNRHHTAQCRMAHQQQRAETFDVVCEQSAACHTWNVTLVPAEARPDEAGALFGAAREVTESRQNRAALRETAAIQQHLVELLPDAIIITGANDRLLFVNSAAVDLLGASSEGEVLGASIWQFVHPESRAHARERKCQLHQGESFDFVEQKLVRLDGSVTSVETASVPIVYQGKRAALVAARDLTGRKSMAEALSRTLDLFDKAFHLGPAALIIARLSDGAILEVSDQMVELTGYGADELVGRDLRALDLWVDDATRDRLAKQLTEDGTVWEAEFQIQRKDGTTRTVLGSAHRVELRGDACLLASAIDITERRQAASAAQESRALLHKIFHASPTAVSIFCMDDGTFFDVNEAMCDLVGYEADTLVDRTAQDLNLWGDPAQYATIMKSLREGESVYDQEIALCTASGEEVTTLSSFQHIHVEGRSCVLAVMTDITARKEAEDALVDAKERAEEIARFRSTLLSNMTHEIRTPLTVILGFTSMLHQGIQDDYRRFVHLIERSGRRLLLTLDSLLDLAQIEAGTLTVQEGVHNVFDVVHGTAGALTGLAEQKGLAFTVDLPETTAYARFDHDLFTHALTHLIDNAVKFTEDGEIVVTAEATDDAVRIHVKDTGVGVGEQFQSRLFEAFSQESEGTNRSHQGSGLGLTVAQRLVERIGGTIRHTSRKGKGSIFTIELPKLPAREARAVSS